VRREVHKQSRKQWQTRDVKTMETISHKYLFTTQQLNNNVNVVVYEAEGASVEHKKNKPLSAERCVRLSDRERRTRRPHGWRLDRRRWRRRHIVI
jgi:hypothetical protein